MLLLLPSIVNQLLLVQAWCSIAFVLVLGGLGQLPAVLMEAGTALLDGFGSSLKFISHVEGKGMRGRVVL